MKSLMLSLFTFFLIPVSAVAELPLTAPEATRYETGLLGLGTGYKAKLMCSCLFVIGQTEEYCRDFAQVSPEVFFTKVNYRKRTVTSRALGFLRTRTATYEGRAKGCTLSAGQGTPTHEGEAEDEGSSTGGNDPTDETGSDQGDVKSAGPEMSDEGAGAEDELN